VAYPLPTALATSACRTARIAFAVPPRSRPDVQRTSSVDSRRIILETSISCGRRCAGGDALFATPRIELRHVHERSKIGGLIGRWKRPIGSPVMKPTSEKRVDSQRWCSRRAATVTQSRPYQMAKPVNPIINNDRKYGRTPASKQAIVRQIRTGATIKVFSAGRE
jgi:hypothetical protein